MSKNHEHIEDQEYEVIGQEGGKLHFGLSIEAKRLWIFIEPDSAGSISLSQYNAEFLGRRLFEMEMILKRLI